MMLGDKEGYSVATCTVEPYNSSRLPTLQFEQIG